MPQLVQGQSVAADPPGVPLEQVLGALVGQTPPTGDGADVEGCWGAGGCGAAIGEEQRPGLTSGDDAGQQTSGAGLKVQPFGVTAFGDRPGALVVQVEVLDVEGEDFLRAGGGLIQQPPQALLPDGDVLAAEQPLQRGVGDGLGAVGSLWAPFQAGAQVDLQPAGAAAEHGERASVATCRFQVAGASAPQLWAASAATAGPSRASSRRSPYAAASALIVCA